ncbi:MAG: universal stress protein [Planctomycetaceae bacterium]
MQQFRRILVGVDLSSADRLAVADLGPPTREAVRRAVWLAKHLSAELTFFTALDVSAHAQELLRDEFEEATRSVEKAAREVLDELVSEAGRDGVPADAKLEFGRPWERILQAVLRNGYDLVIVGTSHAGAASRFLFGSTASKLVRNCPCPVWVTRPDPDWDDLNILVASDLGEVSQQAVHVAVGGAQLAEAKVHLLHAVEATHEHRMWLTGVPDDELQAFREKKRAEAEAALHEQLAETDYRTLPFGVQVHVTEGPPDVAILQAVDEYGIDLLVMGTVARSGIPGLLIGNTAERLMAHVPCSVLAVKPADFECPIAAESD